MIPQPTAAHMEKLEQTDCSENDYFHLSQVSENDQAGELLRLLVSISTVSELPGLFKAVLTELKDLVDFAAADLYLMNCTTAASDSHWIYRHGRVSRHQGEDEPFDPTWGQQNGRSVFPLHTPRQFHRSYWVDMLPAESPLFKKETEFEYSYYIPFWHHLTPVGVMAFRTNRKGGFGPRTTAVLHISAKILTPKFQDLIIKENPTPSASTPPIVSQTHTVNADKDKDSRSFTFGKMIGAGETMQNIFAQVTEVAQTPCSVLILGETGTGKELIAQALHQESGRRNKPLVRVNCAALPPDIIESELFGHEKGSFTGAVDRRIGKFEQANNGTLFLDEVGELPLELQTKLLRVLQEREIERVGGRELIKVNVRIVAATNRDLLQEVKKGNFRSDLYFRLNVFPIVVPPLRDRKEDIPVLAMHFLHKHITDRTKRPAGFSSNVMKQLQAYDWPGNVRELENVIQRCSIRANGEIIKELPAQLSHPEHAIPREARIKTIDEVEREHIISVLKKCKGKVSGVGGAAQALKIPSTTLNSKMRRLDIKFAYINKG
jgi:transcriptional regulator with GAF, ATPase, and Fis domain